MSKVFIFEHPDALYEQCARRILQLARETLATQDHFHLALAGGSTPRELYRFLSALPASEAPEWGRFEFYFGDERHVAPDHPDSNYRMAKEALFAPLGIADKAVHRILGELEPSAAVDHYRQVLGAAPQQHQLPRFDLVLLGMGADGHIASLFPGSPLLQETVAPFGASYVEKLGSWRLSLTLPAINNARHLLLLVSGEKKADIIRHVLHGNTNAMPLPVELLEKEHLEWFMDREAGHLLHEEVEAWPIA